MTNKYGARKCTYNGEVYDSKKEMRRHQELLILEKAGKIRQLRRQVKYVLIPSQREVIWKNGVLKPGKVIEREAAYTADFVYFDNESKEVVVEDVKGVKTKDYILRRKMMLHFHGIRIKEV